MNESDAFEPAPDIGQKDFSLDQIASVAARLLVGVQYAEAADRAILLLEACRGKLNTRQRHAKIRSRAAKERKEWGAKYVLHKEGKMYFVPWREALTHITGHKDEGRAQDRFKKFYEFFWRDCDATQKGVPFEMATGPTAKQVVERMAKFKAEGIHSLRAGTMKAGYEQWSRIDGFVRRQAAAKAKHAKAKKVGVQK